MRFFLAVNPDARTRRDVSGATAALRDAAPAFRWTPEPKLHLTLKFLGEQDDGVIPALSEMLDGIAARHKRFAMRLRHVGAFPNFRRARVVWMGVAPDARLELLHHDVEVACEQQGFPVEGRPFRPHLTLARVPDGTSEDVLRQVARAAKTVDLDEECAVESIDLMRSTTGREGAEYDRLHVAPLR